MNMTTLTNRPCTENIIACNGLYRTVITVNDTTYFLGTFNNALDAMTAYDLVAAAYGMEQCLGEQYAERIA